MCDLVAGFYFSFRCDFFIIRNKSVFVFVGIFKNVRINLTRTIKRKKNNFLHCYVPFSIFGIIEPYLISLFHLYSVIELRNRFLLSFASHFR